MFIIYQYEREGVAKVEELENTKLKLQARLAECEGTVENLNGKLIQLEKSKQKLQQDIEEVGSHVDQANIQHNMMEKKIRQFDKIIVECSWSPLEAIVGVLWRTHRDNGEIKVVDGVGGDRGGDWLLLPLLVRLPDQQPSSDETSAHNYHPQNRGTLGLNLNGVR